MVNFSLLRLLQLQTSIKKSKWRTIFHHPTEYKSLSNDSLPLLFPPIQILIEFVDWWDHRFLGLKNKEKYIQTYYFLSCSIVFQFAIFHKLSTILGFEIYQIINDIRCIPGVQIFESFFNQSRKKLIVFVSKSENNFLFNHLQEL